MTGLEILLVHLKKIGGKENILIGANHYTSSEIQKVESIIEDLQNELGLSSRKPKLSRRRAFVVILEERYYDTSKYPENLTLDSIHKEASLRFEFMNREQRRFKTPTQVHPKNPCLYYEDNSHGKARYKTALQHLVNESHRYFKVPEAEASLESILEQVKLC